ncbi:LacI family DNA-binding transcriptional regulator [Galbitalea sp. SE-J8]|uniref:LacI family DNA-binding transcriptional regulator n=1 Tax=Galbitalea sp. SE-J8 TaxID=3054952 RepID=UPI00259CCC43|nr:LacI family DNA-binding transcriptional regulator [Galbitalea sp. SE-J8]MDM4762042.1 LacI family DNA-binding transcriptional regulator [Galbitalea sp. SE-J8]
MARVTLRDVAEHAGVSTATVSNALNRPELLHRRTLQRVQAAIERTGYVSDESAKQLRKGVGRAIGLIVFDTGNPFFAELARGAEDAAARRGLYVLLANSRGNPERETEYIRFMGSQRVRGLIVAPAGDISRAAHDFADRDAPFVMLGEAEREVPFPTISGDDTRGGMMAARHLLDLGRRRIAWVGGPLTVSQLAHRLAGARAAVAEVPDAALSHVPTETQDIEAGIAAGERLLALPAGERPDAVQAGTDLLALGVIQALQRDGRLRVPEDVAVIGYDDMPFAASVSVPLSTVRHPTSLMGKTAIDLLLDETPAEDTARRHLVFLPEIVVRASTAPPPPA